jgi:ribosome-binding protein aMBF1 (putative translation factor)
VTGTPCWVCGHATRRVTYRHHYTKAVLWVVDECTRCQSSKAVLDLSPSHGAFRESQEEHADHAEVAA